ncbi:unnamed protein product [Prunus armeniaca]
MRKQAAEVQASCPKCFTIPTTEESFTISLTEDWRALKDGVTSSHARDTRWRMRRTSRSEKAPPAAVEFWILLAYYEKGCT